MNALKLKIEMTYSGFLGYRVIGPPLKRDATGISQMATLSIISNSII